MPNEMPERYRRWFEYEQDAHAKVLRSLETVPAERRGAPEYRRALTLLAHLAAGRRIWLCRIGAIAQMPTAIFPENVVLPAAVEELRAVQQHWTAYLERLTDEELNRVVEYQSLDGGRFRNRVEDILTQLYGHSLYHRGQIAMLVRQAGGEPAATDFIYWCREPLT